MALALCISCLLLPPPSAPASCTCCLHAFCASCTCRGAQKCCENTSRSAHLPPLFSIVQGQLPTSPLHTPTATKFLFSAILPRGMILAAHFWPGDASTQNKLFPARSDIHEKGQSMHEREDASAFARCAALVTFLLLSNALFASFSLHSEVAS